MKFRSKFEKGVYEKATDHGGELEYEPRSRIISYVDSSFYLADFVLPNGIYVECKGWFSPRDRRKMLAVRRCNPNCDIRMVFMRASNRLTKGKNSMTYGKWCEKYDIQWAEGSIPTEWWNEK
jgi:hypothetical protein